MIPDETDLTVAEVAARLRVRPNAVRALIKAGRLAAYQTPGREWRVPLAALDEACRPAAVEGPAAGPPRRQTNAEREHQRAVAYLESIGIA